jgi:DNA-binding HxlR family transcriptional regulator
MKSAESMAVPELKIMFNSCPVEATMGVLGRKWALLVLRDIGLYRKQRFNEMLKITPGLTKRVLSMRLRELSREGYIEVVERGRSYSKWDLTEKGRDVLPVLMALVQFGSKWYADRVFSDKTPRALEDVFHGSYIRKIMKNLREEIPAQPLVRARGR